MAHLDAGLQSDHRLELLLGYIQLAGGERSHASTIIGISLAQGVGLLLGNYDPKRSE